MLCALCSVLCALSLYSGSVLWVWALSCVLCALVSVLCALVIMLGILCSLSVLCTLCSGLWLNTLGVALNSVSVLWVLALC